MPSTPRCPLMRQTAGEHLAADVIDALADTRRLRSRSAAGPATTATLRERHEEFERALVGDRGR